MGQLDPLIYSRRPRFDPWRPHFLTLSRDCLDVIGLPLVHLCSRPTVGVVLIRRWYNRITLDFVLPSDDRQPPSANLEPSHSPSAMFDRIPLTRLFIWVVDLREPIPCCSTVSCPLVMSVSSASPAFRPFGLEDLSTFIVASGFVELWPGLLFNSALIPSKPSGSRISPGNGPR